MNSGLEPTLLTMDLGAKSGWTKASNAGLEYGVAGGEVGAAMLAPPPSIPASAL
jgi:hypothetical protein